MYNTNWDVSRKIPKKLTFVEKLLYNPCMVAKKTKSGRGRPPFPASKRASKVIGVRITPTVMAAIDEARGSHGRSAWIRMAIRQALT